MGISGACVERAPGYLSPLKKCVSVCGFVHLASDWSFYLLFKSVQETCCCVKRWSVFLGFVSFSWSFLWLWYVTLAGQVEAGTHS